MIDRTQLTDAQIDEIFNAMPDGADGWLKSWGYQQFARAVADQATAKAQDEIAKICDEVAKRSQEKASLNNGRESDMCFGQVIAAEAIASEIRARGNGGEG